ncbi:hypothetical protein [Streptomyces sp. 3N207]|uniref:hypothetical protein n=1 Tax=Streptomyces sp. 3N207 TaxID=3457417 RepID=UPI003FD2B93B
MIAPHNEVSREKADDLTVPAPDHALGANGSAEAWREELDPQARSYYLFEFVYEETPNSSPTTWAICPLTQSRAAPPWKTSTAART